MVLETTTEQVEGPAAVTIVRLDGELDASNFEGLTETVRGLYDGGTRRLLLDLSGLRFMASSGLVALHSIVRIMHGERPLDTEAGWSALRAEIGDTQTEVQLCAPQPAVARVLSRTGIERMFIIHPDRAAALAAL
jgi:anti-sigma B factor antagonist/serine/threonine-protein kinase RsbW